jgi:hypothetical protein
MKDLPQFTPGCDEEMRAFHQSLGIDPKVTQRAIEMRRRNPVGDDLEVEKVRPAKPKRRLSLR